MHIHIGPWIGHYRLKLHTERVNHRQIHYAGSAQASVEFADG